MIDFSKIKLIIWDLDDTFWQGTLSEGQIVMNSENIKLIHELTDRGIVNSICSKNNRDEVDIQLKEIGLEKLFVFKSIDWSPKGQRIAKLVKEMGLRPQNCLFLDDNIQNLNEAKYYSPDLMIAEPDILGELRQFFVSLPISDANHSRLKNYQVLEQKQNAKSKASNNEEFLYSSKTQVQIHEDCLSQIDRIYELVNRTNQLNYTKIRSTKEELEELIKDSRYQCGYVTVSDKFGDYGIVGFYALRDNQLIHFLFSCRTIGQGVEQYVYATLGHPGLDVKGEVVNYVTDSPAPAWINMKDNTIPKEIKTKYHHKVILKGGCDLQVMSEYLNTDSIIKEFTYFGLKRHNNIEHHNHSVNYLGLPFLSLDEQMKLTENLIFNDEEMYKTSVYDDDVSLIFVSTMVEPNLGIYKNRKTGMKIAFGEFLYPLTDTKCWNLYINNEIFTADNNFTKDWLKSFSNEWEFFGHLSPSEIVSNAKEFLSKINKNAKVCYFLGSETPYFKNTQPNYDNRHLVYKEINDKMREFAKNNDRVLLIDFNDFIQGQEDFTNNINHFVRRVYYDVATKANEYIAELTGEKLQQKSRFYLWRKSLVDRIGRTGFYQTRFYIIARKPYVWMRNLLQIIRFNHRE